MRILFFDPSCVRPYTKQTPSYESIGGTEASVIRVAEALGRRGHEVFVSQHNRAADCAGESDASYIAAHNRRRYEAARDPDVVILMQRLQLAGGLRKAYPRARLYAWLHCPPRPQYESLRAEVVEADCTIVAVSDSHRARLVEALLGQGAHGATQSDLPLPRVERIYSPVDDDLLPDDTPRDPDKLLFPCSPHKGLGQIMRAFRAVRGRRPSARLYLANPGYVAYPEADLGDAVALGALPFPQTVRHMREAFCVFYAQTTLMETFGLVYAEANAVGTPVLAHPFGSAPEVLCSREQLVDAADPEHVADVLMSWYDGAAPPACCKDELRLSRVIEEWEALLGARPARTTS